MKRALAATILGFAALWPLGHRLVVAAFDANPWKLSGWAMYTIPTPPVRVTLLRSGDDGPTRVDERALPGETRRVVDRFRVERHALGRLLPPDEAGRAVLAARPQLDWVVFVVETLRLDRKTALMTSKLDRYVYERSP